MAAVHVPSDGGTVPVDVLLDHAGVPGGLDAAWQPKHYLGAPVPGANLATLNLARVALAPGFAAAEIAETEDAAGAAVSDASALPLDLHAAADAVAPAGTEHVA